ncbi:hypothetical protein LTR24_006605 [Lithohypha guttulata]|uniref:Xylanolytic transcriptional activator regulatory domain-containing protein n=1 Tax=Lithohypha guttulata TaxID=1690604 RepID=A0ABR0K5K1_9EURO|nr:hypothetical protein LTR24_006605 [Lithohypha guttulata]
MSVKNYVVFATIEDEGKKIEFMMHDSHFVVCGNFVELIKAEKACDDSCDGNQPCSRCAARSVPCIYRPNEDERSRASTKRRLAELQSDSQLLHDLLQHIRDGKDAESSEVVSLIRSNASFEEISQYLVHPFNEAASDETEICPDTEEMRTRIGAAILQNMSSAKDPRTSQTGAPSSGSRHVLSVKRLIDTPIHHVQAAPWTQVTDDNHLVSHLVSLWVTWDHCFPNGVVFELFLRDMQSKNLESTFCSPFLVNCILAAACLYSDYEEVRSCQGKSSDLMAEFVKEAEKHLEEDDFKTNVTNVQGLSILFLLLLKMNQDRRGFGYVGQATALCAELMRARDKIVSKADTSEKAKELSYVLDYACWGTFSSTTGAILLWQRPQSMFKPRHPYPDVVGAHEHFFGKKWMPYPGVGDEQETFLDEVQRQWGKLAVLERELSLVLYEQVKAPDPADDLPRQRALVDLDERLTSWLERLPDHFKYLSPWTPPSIFVLRLWSQSALMVTLLARITYCSREDHSQDHLPEGTPSSASLDPHCDPVRERLLNLSVEVVEFIRCCRSAIPNDVDRLNCMVARPLHQALSIFLDAKARSSENLHRYDSQIIDICTTLRAISRRVPFVFTVLRAIQLDVRRRKIVLPQETQKMLEEFEQNDLKVWKDDASYTRAMYSFSEIAPNVGQLDATGRQAKTMGEFLEEFENLDLHSGNEDSSTHFDNTPRSLGT